MPKINKNSTKSYMVKYIADHNLKINPKQKKADLYTALAKAGHVQAGRGKKVGAVEGGRGKSQVDPKAKDKAKFQRARKNLKEYVTGRGTAGARGGFGTASAVPKGKSKEAKAERARVFRQYTGKKVVFSNVEGEATIVGGMEGEFGLKVGDRVIPMTKSWKPIWAPTQTGTLTWLKKWGEAPGPKKSAKKGTGAGVGVEKNIKLDPRAIAIPKKVSKEDFDKARLDLTRILAQYKK